MTPAAGPSEANSTSDSQTGFSLLRVCGLYVGLVLVLLSLLQVNVVQHSLLEPLRTGVAWAVSRMLNLLGVVAMSTGSRVLAPGLSAEILTECIGIEAIILILPAVLVFPASWRAKALGMLLSLGVMAAVNFVRVVSVCYIGVYWPRAMALGHLYLWPVVVIIMGVATLLFWVDRIVPRIDR